MRWLTELPACEFPTHKSIQAFKHHAICILHCENIVIYFRREWKHVVFFLNLNSFWEWCADASSPILRIMNCCRNGPRPYWSDQIWFRWPARRRDSSNLWFYIIIYQRKARNSFHGRPIGQSASQTQFLHFAHIFTFNFMIKAIQLLCLGILIQFITFYLHPIS